MTEIKAELRVVDQRYYADGLTWEQDIARKNRNSRALAWIVASIMSLVAIVSLAALALLVPLKTYEPYMVVVDKTTGFVEVKRPMAEGPLSQDEAVTTFNVVRYVKARETYDPKALKDNFDLAQLLANGDAARELTELYSPANPKNPVKVFGTNTIVSVSIKSVTFPNNRTALVRFSTEQKSATDIISGNWVSLVRFRYTSSPMRNEFRFDNPLGFQVLEYRRDQETGAVARDGWSVEIVMRPVSISFTALMSLFAIAPAFAEAVPAPGRTDPRIRNVVYNKDNVVAVDATYGTSTMIELQPDEKIETLALGDSIAWKVEPNRKGDIIFVKPVEKDAQSNLNVVTDKRVYAFILRSNTRPPSGQLYEVRFRFPDDEADAKLLNLAKERAANPNLKDLNIANANSDYGYKGSSVNKPVTVFDDGTKTWFRFEGETPAIYIVDAERNESLVNFRTEGPYVVVDKVSRQWTLRNGAESTCIFNRRLTNVHEPDGLEPYAPQRVGQPSSSSAGG